MLNLVLPSGNQTWLANPLKSTLNVWFHQFMMGNKQFPIHENPLSIEGLLDGKFITGGFSRPRHPCGGAIPDGFTWFPLDIPWNPHVSMSKSQIFMVKSPFFMLLLSISLWFSHGFPMVFCLFQWFSHGFPILAIFHSQPASAVPALCHSASKSWGRRRPVISERCTWDISSWTTLGIPSGNLTVCYWKWP